MAVVCIAVLVGIVLGVFRYFRFVSKTVYEESVSHLTEVFHQSDNMMRELTDKNLTYLHIWGENLQNILSEDEICDYIKKAQEDAGFLEFFFLSADGDYKMATGETGYLGLQENMEEEIRQGNDVIANAAVPGKSQLLIFATPKAHGIYQGFEYDAIAIAYENADIVIGSRFLHVKKEISARMIGSRLITVMIKLTTGKRVADPTSGMRMFSKEMIKRFAQDDSLNPEPESISLLIKKGAKVSEVQVEMRERQAGESYLNISKSIAYMARACISILFVQWFR